MKYLIEVTVQIYGYSYRHLYTAKSKKAAVKLGLELLKEENIVKDGFGVTLKNKLNRRKQELFDSLDNEYVSSRLTDKGVQLTCIISNAACDITITPVVEHKWHRDSDIKELNVARDYIMIYLDDNGHINSHTLPPKGVPIDVSEV